MSSKSSSRGRPITTMINELQQTDSKSAVMQLYLFMIPLGFVLSSPLAHSEKPFSPTVAH